MGASMSTRTFSFVLLGILLAALARHLWLAAYVHPFGDDFSYAVAGMHTELLLRLAVEYDSWNGRYFSNILLLRGPMVLGLQKGLVIYRCAAIVLILFTLFAAYRFLQQAFGNAISTIAQWSIALVFLLFFLHRMPDASEGFYWYTGSMTYQLPNALSLLLLGNWIAFFRKDGSSGIGWSIAQVLLVIVIAGCNELHMALLVLLHLALLVFSYQRMRKHDPVVIGLLFVSVACAVVVFAAPGNDTRGALFPHRHELLRTIGYAFAQTARFTGTWLFLSTGVLFSLALVIQQRAFGANSPLHSVLLRMNKWLALVLPFALVFISMVVTYWPTGLLGQYRTVNVALFYFVPAWCLAMLVWDVQVLRTARWSFRDLDQRTFQWAFLLLCVITFFFLGRDGRVSSDLITGRAKKYDQGVTEGYRLITGAVHEELDQLQLPFVETPKSLHILPLDTSPDHWTNRSLANYFGDPALNITVAPAQ